MSARPVARISGQEAPAEEFERRWQAPDATREAEIVCEPCNTGWMSDLEGVAAPILEPMMLGEPRTLDVAEQGIVALWAAKMTMVWEATHAYVRAVSNEDYVHVYRWCSPPTDWRVWLAAFSPRPASEDEDASPPPFNTFYYKHPLRLLPAEVHHTDPAPVRAEDVNGHLATFGVGAFIFQTFGAFGDLNIGRPAALHEEQFAPYLRRIWPSVDPVRWPPGRILDITTLRELINSRLV